MPLGSISCPTCELLEPESPRKLGIFRVLCFASMMLLLGIAAFIGESTYIPAPRKKQHNKTQFYTTLCMYAILQGLHSFVHESVPFNWYFGECILNLNQIFHIMFSIKSNKVWSKHHTWVAHSCRAIVGPELSWISFRNKIVFIHTAFLFYQCTFASNIWPGLVKKKNPILLKNFISINNVVMVNLELVSQQTHQQHEPRY